MTGHDADPRWEGRRHEIIAGSRVTIIMRGNVETVRGAPKCRWCGKPLRPTYLTERAPQESRHYFDKRPKHVSATLDEKRNQWLVVSTSFRIVRRTFEGSFGGYGDNYFCGLNCGRDFAIAVMDSLISKKFRLISKAGGDARVEKPKKPRKVSQNE